MAKQKEPKQNAPTSQGKETKPKQSGERPDPEKDSRHNRTREYGGGNPNDFERQQDKGYGQEPFDEQQFEQDSGSGSFNEGGAKGNAHGQ